MREIIVALMLVACGTEREIAEAPPHRDPAPQPEPQPEPPPPQPPAEERFDPPPPDMECDDMNANQCMASTRCVLDPPPDAGAPYVCREAVPPCEGGIGQADRGFEADCVGRDGCVYQEAQCTCFPETRVPIPNRGPVPECFCGGGPPRRCVPE